MDCIRLNVTRRCLTAGCLTLLLTFTAGGEPRLGSDESGDCDALIEAIAYRDTTVMRQLFDRGADANCTVTRRVSPWMGEGPLFYHTTPLIEAVKTHDLGVVTMVLDAGAEPSRPARGEREPPLLFAIRPRWGYDIPIACALLERGADPFQVVYDNPIVYDTTYHGLFPVLRAATTMAIKVGQAPTLMEHMPALRQRLTDDSNVYRREYLLELKRLLDPTNTPEAGPPAMEQAMLAIVLDDLALLRQVLADDPALGVAVTATGWPLLSWALIAGNVEACQAMTTRDGVAQPSPVTRWGATYVHCATQGGNVEALRFALAIDGPSIDRLDLHGMSPLNIALQERYDELLHELLAVGADTSNGRVKGRSPQEEMERRRMTIPAHPHPATRE